MIKIIVSLALTACFSACSTSQKGAPAKAVTTPRAAAVITERKASTAPEGAAEIIAVPQTGEKEIKTQPRAVAEAEKARKAEAGE